MKKFRVNLFLMKVDIKLLILTVIYNLINLFLLWAMTTAKHGNALGVLYLFLFYWIIALFVTGYYVQKYKEKWFSSDFWFSSVILLIFNTPIPVMYLMYLLEIG